MKSRRSLLDALVIALLLAAGCSKNDASTQPQSSGAPGPVESFNSGVFSSSSPVRVYVHTFPTAGTYSYRCTVHGSSMSGGVEVAAAHPDSPFVSIDDDFFSPSLARVKPGGYVKWIANGGSHGVRSN